MKIYEVGYLHSDIRHSGVRISDSVWNPNYLGMGLKSPFWNLNQFLFQTFTVLFTCILLKSPFWNLNPFWFRTFTVLFTCILHEFQGFKVLLSFFICLPWLYTTFYKQRVATPIKFSLFQIYYFQLVYFCFWSKIDNKVFSALSLDFWN